MVGDKLGVAWPQKPELPHEQIARLRSENQKLLDELDSLRPTNPKLPLHARLTQRLGRVYHVEVKFQPTANFTVSTLGILPRPWFASITAKSQRDGALSAEIYAESAELLERYVVQWAEDAGVALTALQEE